MKLSPRFVLLLPFAFVLSTGVFAQQKIAYVDIAAVMKALPEAQEAQRQLDALVEGWQKELERIQNTWEKKFEDYDKRKLILTDQGRANAEKELRELDLKISAFRDQKFGQNGELFKKEDELMRPIQDLVYDQVNKLSLEEGYDLVFDKSGGAMIIYGKESLDLTKKLITRIEKALPPRKVSGGQETPGQQPGQMPGQMPGQRPGQEPPQAPGQLPLPGQGDPPPPPPPGK